MTADPLYGDGLGVMEFLAERALLGCAEKSAKSTLGRPKNALKRVLRTAARGNRHAFQDSIHVMGGEQKRAGLLQFRKVHGRIRAIVSPAMDISREVCPGYVIFRRSFIEGITAGAFT
jgi:hypothetical protein